MSTFNNKSGLRQAKQGEAVQQLVTYSLGNEKYGIDIVKVQEIIRVPEITRVPQMPDFIEGIINLRGHVIPIIDLRHRFTLGDAPDNADRRIIVVSALNRTLGFIVDTVSHVIKIPVRQIEPPPAIIAGIEREFITGVAMAEGSLIIILDLDKILTPQERIKLEQAPTDIA